MTTPAETKVHRDICDRFKTDHRFYDVRRGPADIRSPAELTVEASVDPNSIFDASYPESEARLEISFRLNTQTPYNQYWFNWIEPNRDALIGWHQDETHQNLGEVHFQLNHKSTVIERVEAAFLNVPPMQVVELRYNQVEGAIRSIQWNNDVPIEINW